MATKPNPFAAFEKSKADTTDKGMKEGSKKELAADRKLMAKTPAKAPAKKKC
jgi:hypothetical protein